MWAGSGGGTGGGSYGQPSQPVQQQQQQFEQSYQPEATDNLGWRPLAKITDLTERQLALHEKQAARRFSNELLKPHLLPKFDGLKPLEVFGWCQSIETAFRAAGAEAELYESVAVAKVAAALKGPVAAWFNLNTATLLAGNWFQFKTALMKKYGLQEKESLASSSLLQLCSTESSDYDAYVAQFNILLNMIVSGEDVLTAFEAGIIFQAFKRGMPSCLRQTAALYKGKDLNELREHLAYFMSRDPDLAKRAGYATGASGVVPTPMDLGLASRHGTQ